MIPLEEAYKRMKKEYTDNLHLIDAFHKVATERIQYFERCEEHIKRDLDSYTERIDIITEAIIDELREM